jgi:hypothetical protein
VLRDRRKNGGGKKETGDISPLPDGDGLADPVELALV